MDTVVVYKANPESLQKVLGLLRKEGFNPKTLDNRVSATDLHGAGRATYLISVAVPRHEARSAASVLRKWDKAQESEVSELTGKLAGPFILSAMIIAALAVIFLLLGILFDAVAVLAVVWIVLFALLANADKVMLKARRPKRR